MVDNRLFKWAWEKKMISSQIGLAMGKQTNLSLTPFVLVCLSSIIFWDVPKYCPVSKNKSH